MWSVEVFSHFSGPGKGDFDNLCYTALLDKGISYVAYVSQMQWSKIDLIPMKLLQPHLPREAQVK